MCLCVVRRKCKLTVELQIERKEEKKAHVQAHESELVVEYSGKSLLRKATPYLTFLLRIVLHLPLLAISLCNLSLCCSRSM